MIGRHDRHLLVEFAIGGQVLCPELIPGAVDFGGDEVGIAGGSAEARKVLSARNDALGFQAAHELAGEGDDVRGARGDRAGAHDLDGFRQGEIDATYGLDDAQVAAAYRWVY